MPGDSTRRYPLELRQRAVRMVAEIAGEHESEWAAMSRVAAPVESPVIRPARSGKARSPDPDGARMNTSWCRAASVIQRPSGRSCAGAGAMALRAAPRSTRTAL